MPPKVKIIKEDIIKTAVDLVRSRGKQAINARAIADALNCSTQPIFSNFTTMEELMSEVMLAAYDKYMGFINNEVESGKYPQYKAFGMAYVRFAKEEKELFKLLFMCDRREAEMIPTADFENSVQMIMESTGLSKEKAMLFHLEMWTAVHGIGTILATSFIPLEFDLISEMLTDIYQGLRIRHLKEEDQNERN